MQSKKHELEYFKNDSWPVRIGALIILRLPFKSAIAVLIAAFVGNGPLLAFLLKRFS